MMNKLLRRTLPILLAVSVVLPTVTGCGMNQAQQVSANIVPQVDTDQIVKATTQAILERIEDQPTVETVIESAESVDSSDAWEEYIGDFETFVYGLLVNELRYKYDVFQAYVELEDGITVCGIGYTDYSECYANEDETYVEFTAGFIPYYGELTIPDEEFEDGINLYDVDYSDDNFGFILGYESDEFAEHCVVYGKYLKYGVDSQGCIFYETQEFDKDTCDTSLGSLYSYDENKYLYETEVGDYEAISGTPLSTYIDYSELEKSINEVIDNQDLNFATVDVETYANLSREAIESYLLSMQEETFLGYDVDYLVEIASQIDPTECYQITQDGLIVVNRGGDATTLVKWMVGTGCVIVTSIGLVGTMVSIEHPALSAASEAVIGIGIEIFMQVVIEGKSLDSIQWRDVVLAAATGAISALVGPYIGAKYSGVSYYIMDSAIDGVLGGFEQSVVAWLDGESGQEIIQRFGYGFAMGMALSGAFKCVAGALGKMIVNAGPIVSKLEKKLFPKLSKKKSSLNDYFYKLKKKVDSSKWHSKFLSNKIKDKQLNRIQNKGDDNLLKRSVDKLTKKNEILDINNNVISKEQLKDIAVNAKDGEHIGKILVDGEVVDVVKQNGAIGIFFDENKYTYVTLSEYLVDDRDENMIKAAELFKEKWIEDPTLVPESIDKYLKNQNINLEDLKPNKIVEIIKDSDMVLHENIDMQTVTLVSRSLHDKTDKWGGVAHMGGFGLAKYLKCHMGSEFFDRFLSVASTEFATGG